MKIIVILATAMCVGSVIAYPQISDEQFKSEVSRPMRPTPLFILDTLEFTRLLAVGDITILTLRTRSSSLNTTLGTLLRSLELGGIDRNNSTPLGYSIPLVRFEDSSLFEGIQIGRWRSIILVIYLLDIDKIFIFDTNANSCDILCFTTRKKCWKKEGRNRNLCFHSNNSRIAFKIGEIDGAFCSKICWTSVKSFELEDRCFAFDGASFTRGVLRPRASNLPRCSILWSMHPRHV